MEEDKKLALRIINNPECYKTCMAESFKHKRISYIPYLLPKPKKPIPSCPPYQTFTTSELLKQAEEIIENISEKEEDLKCIHNILSERKDLFESVLDFVEKKDIFLDDLFYWHPNYEICDIFSFMLSFFQTEPTPEILERYKIHHGRAMILGKRQQKKIIQLLKERYSSSIFTDIEVMEKDIEIFPESVNNKLSNKGTEYLIKTCQERGIDISTHLEVYSKVISQSYWSDEEEKLVSYYHKNMVFDLLSHLSFIEVRIIDKKEITVLLPLNVFHDLLDGNKRSRRYLEDKGFMYENGEYKII
ncbi:hypothetical protein TCON_0257 [Astathelohania contejeani]|uniref:Uncharacterized protein n=1 Tax=Astathelohania contejeani TaxID=164912 RepID=A0ABQ7I252_9MICR|nr:hypothetical protein TCON_0257 [Thelohania contejeani]